MRFRRERRVELALVAAAVLIVLRACDARRGPPLEPWHTLSAEEAPAEDILQADWQDYVAMEDALFARVRAGLDAELTPRDEHPLNRYTAGSLSSPARFPRD